MKLYFPYLFFIRPTAVPISKIFSFFIFSSDIKLFSWGSCPALNILSWLFCTFLYWKKSKNQSSFYSSEKLNISPKFSRSNVRFKYMLSFTMIKKPSISSYLWYKGVKWYCCARVAKRLFSQRVRKSTSRTSIIQYFIYDHIKKYFL